MTAPQVNGDRIAEIFEFARSFAESIDIREVSRGHDVYHTPLWDFTRLLKGEWALMCWHDACTNLQSWMTAYGRSLTEFSGVDSEEDGMLEIEANWEIVRVPAGRTPLEWALEQARARPIFHQVTRCGESFLMFINMCYYLQGINGDKAMLLPTRDVAELMLGDRNKFGRVAQLIRVAEGRGFLVKLSVGSYAKHLSSEFRFLGYTNPTHRNSELKNTGVETKAEKTEPI